MDGYALNDIPRSGVENMALDQRMLEVAAAQQCVLLRVYRWSEPTLSLGYFQPYVQRLTHSASVDLPVVRRATGGGAIVHHYDWTYSIAVPAQVLSARTQRSAQAQSTIQPGGQVGSQQSQARSELGASLPLYDCMHDAVVQWLGTQGIVARKWSPQCAAAESAGSTSVDGRTQASDMQRRFLCFERRNCGDVVWEAHKVMGSAQRRGDGAILQHGSLLLASSPYAPSLQGLSPTRELTSQSLLGGTAPSADLLESFFQHLSAAVSSATGVSLRQAANLEQTPCQWQWPSPTRFAEGDWTHRV